MPSSECASPASSACACFALQGDVQRYFIPYELETPDVVGGAAYLARLISPTPWSQRIMPQLRSFTRGGGSVAAASGAGLGGFVIAQVFEDIAALDGTAVVVALARSRRPGKSPAAMLGEAECAFWKTRRAATTP